jgi:hypothetical protein
MLHECGKPVPSINAGIFLTQFIRPIENQSYVVTKIYIYSY